ncbi:MAG: penicillin-binding protein 2 [Cytophagales bacterium]|nr:penicillin-binding protein 2 [Cytophagales bacterium]
MNNNSKYIIQFTILFVSLVFTGRLFSLQVLDKNYKLAAEDNAMRPIIEYPYRGVIYDRNGKLIVHNTPVYDLMIIPKEVKMEDTLAFCQLVGITQKEFEEKIKTLKKQRRYALPSVLVKQIPGEEFAKIQSSLINYPGFNIVARTVRGYPYGTLANALGYMREIDQKGLDKDTANYYKQGDYIGISGVEASYEEPLRGKRGVQYKMVDAIGVVKGAFNNGAFDTLSIPGQNLYASIDIDLQNYAEQLLDNKRGSIVAIEPSSGEILTIVSRPSYDPNSLSGRDLSKNYRKLTQDTLKPLFNRPIMATYPPGSIFKTLQALIALQEGVISPNEQIYCDGGLIGDHAPPGYYNVHRGIKYSSNNYFFKVFKRIINQRKHENTFIDARIGLTNWREYVAGFGLGHKLGVDIPNEKGGHIPDTSYYDRFYGKNRWKFSNIYSLSIGQGEMLMTPIQMANLAAILANKGYYYIPHIIKGVGDENQPLPEYRKKYHVGIDSSYYTYVIDAMQEALSGTAGRAIIQDIEICGKTGTAENPHGEDHSVFMAFAPKDDPKIAIAVYVENAGWGGRAAASTASLLIEKYIRGEITRPWLEDYVLKGKFIY